MTKLLLHCPNLHRRLYPSLACIQIVPKPSADVVVELMYCCDRRRQMALSHRAYQIVSGRTRHQPEVVDSVADHVTRLSTNDVRPYFLYETPADVTSQGSPRGCCDVTRRTGNPSERSHVTSSRDLLTLEVPSLASHGGGATGRLRLVRNGNVGGRVIDRCCSHVAVLPLLPPPPERTCVTWSDKANQLVVQVDDTATTQVDDERRRVADVI